MIKTKLTHKDRANIQARYNLKFEEYTKLTLDELKEIFNSKKLSNTDRKALIDSTSYLLYQQQVKDSTKNDEISADLQTDAVVE